MGLMIFNPQGGLELSLPPVPAKLPVLCETICERCEGLGYLESFDPMLSERCTGCFGRGTVEVCEGCGRPPEVKDGLEYCGCTFSGTQACNTLSPCEFCGTLHPGSSLIFGSCGTCFDEAHERYKAEVGEDGLIF